MFTPKQNCARCHFLMVQVDQQKREVNENQRRLMRFGDYSWVHREHDVLGCFMGVWDESHNFPSERRHELLVEMVRTVSCFFFLHSPGMLFSTAQEIIEKRPQQKEISMTSRLMILGLIISVIYLIVAIIYHK